MARQIVYLFQQAEQCQLGLLGFQASGHHLRSLLKRHRAICSNLSSEPPPDLRRPRPAKGDAARTKPYGLERSHMVWGVALLLSNSEA